VVEGFREGRILLISDSLDPLSPEIYGKLDLKFLSVWLLLSSECILELSGKGDDS